MRSECSHMVLDLKTGGEAACRREGLAKAAPPGIIPGIPEAPGQYSPALMSFSVTPSPWGMMSLMSNTLTSLARPCFCHLPCKFSGSKPAHTWDSREGVCSLSMAPTDTGQFTQSVQVLAPAQHAVCPLMQTQQQRAPAMTAGGLRPPTKGVSSLTDIQGRQQAAQPPRAGRCPLLPLSCTLAWCPGIPVHSLELSSAEQPYGAAGGGQAICPLPRKQASPHPSPMLPGIPQGWSISHFMGVLWLSQGAVACCSPSHLPPAHRAGGWDRLAAAPARAQGI